MDDGINPFTYYVFDDFDHVLRPLGSYDIGAYEYHQ